MTDGAAIGSAESGAPLSVDIGFSRGDFALRVAFAAAAGETLAVLGPNGAGKSTILSIIAGLLSPDHGSMILGGRELTRVERGVPTTTVPPEHRRIGLMGQDPLLFPHLSATENVAFGPRAQGTPRGVARQVAREWLARLGLEQFMSRKPAELSGGQRQRVALARALAAAPDLLLLDEPLGALDARTAPEVRQLLRTHLRESGTTAVLVTHDALDAAVLADRVVVVDGGRIVDEGRTPDVLSAPRSTFGAALAGLNLVVGSAVASGDAGTLGAVRTGSAPGLLLAGVAADRLTSEQPAAAVFSPSAVAVYRERVIGSPRNHWPARITSMQAGTAAIRLQTSGAADVAVDLTAAAVAELGLELGAEVYLSVKAAEVRIYPH